MRPSDIHELMGSSSLIQVIACRLSGTKPSSEPMLNFCQLDSQHHISVKFLSQFFSFENLPEKVVREMLAILPWYQCVNGTLCALFISIMPCGNTAHFLTLPLNLIIHMFVCVIEFGRGYFDSIAIHYQTSVHDFVFSASVCYMPIIVNGNLKYMLPTNDDILSYL